MRATEWRGMPAVCWALCLSWMISGVAAAADSGWYLTVGAGRAETEASFGSRHLKSVADDEEAGAVTLGREVHRYLAVEGAYLDFGPHGGFGSPCAESTEACIERLAALELCAVGTDCTRVVIPLHAEIRGYSLSLVPKLPLTRRLALRGKVGALVWDAELHGGAGFGRIEDDSGEDLLLGIGLQYDFAAPVGMSIQHDRSDLDLEATLVSLHWRF